MLQEAIAKVVAGSDLTAQEAEAALEEIMSGQASEAQIAALLVGLRMKGEKPSEIAGLARTMREHCVKVRPQREDVVDTCGTGGDALDTFNISTAAAFIAAGAGVAIAKHGNRSVSSQCGSADVLAELGVNLEVEPGRVGECIDRVGLGFLFAPAHHPAMRHVMPTRQALGLRTVFNILGPLTNPAGARRQLLGVYDPALTTLVAEALRELGSERALVVHGLDGLDELSTLGPTQVAELAEGEVREYTVAPQDVGLRKAGPDDISGGDTEECARRMTAVLEGEPGPRLDIALLNAAGVIVAAGSADSLEEGLEQARESVDSGRAREKLGELVEFTNAAAP